MSFLRALEVGIIFFYFYFFTLHSSDSVSQERIFFFKNKTLRRQKLGCENVLHSSLQLCCQHCPRLRQSQPGPSGTRSTVGLSWTVSSASSLNKVQNTDLFARA